MNVIGYVRVSTREQGDSGLGLEAQRFTLEAEAARRGWTLTVVTEIGSGKEMARRHVLRGILDRLDRGEADAIAVSKQDRIGRSVLDFSTILARATAGRHQWSVIVLDTNLDTNTPAGKMLATILMAAAEYERSMISLRTKDALSAAKRRGQRLGAPSGHDRDALAYAVQMRAAGLSYRAIAETLTAEGYRTAGGFTKWHETTVARALRTHRLDQEAAA